jgi:hypothetical protein
VQRARVLEMMLAGGVAPHIIDDFRPYLEHDGKFNLTSSNHIVTDYLPALLLGQIEHVRALLSKKGTYFSAIFDGQSAPRLPQSIASQRLVSLTLSKRSALGRVSGTGVSHGR